MTPGKRRCATAILAVLLCDTCGWNAGIAAGGTPFGPWPRYGLPCIPCGDGSPESGDLLQHDPHGTSLAGDPPSAVASARPPRDCRAPRRRSTSEDFAQVRATYNVSATTTRTDPKATKVIDSDESGTAMEFARELSPVQQPPESFGKAADGSGGQAGLRPRVLNESDGAAGNLDLPPVPTKIAEFPK